MARTAMSSSRYWGLMLRGKSVGSTMVQRRRSRAGTSGMSQLDVKLGSHLALQGGGGQGGLTSSRPNTTEGVVELVEFPTVGVEHLEVEEGLTLTSHFVVRI